MFHFQIPGSVSDDEESMFDGSGSGSGCFEVTAVPGLCDVSFNNVLLVLISSHMYWRNRYKYDINI